MNSSSSTATSTVAESFQSSWPPTGEAEEGYAVACEEFGERKRGHTQFWKYLKELDALGLIDAKVSRNGMVGKTTMISLPEIPAKVLEERLESGMRP